MAKNPVRYQIVRGPTRKPVSGMYRDKTEAIAKADDLDQNQAFTYRVKKRRCADPQQ